ncbi:DNA modification methylase [Metapseudomonas resinovorans]|uniref:DNA-methyltransferase n=1 Tax=Metapseudomonas resinovorans TaxID=53412 RepID=UPI003D1A46A6
MMSLATHLLSEFNEVVGCALALPDEYLSPYERLCEHLATKVLRSPPERRRWLIAHINRKFKFNAGGTASLYATAASLGYTFNYHEKTSIQLAFDLSDQHEIERVLAVRGLPPAVYSRLIAEFKPISEGETVQRFNAERSEPTKLRREKGDRPVDREILLAAFSAYLFCVAEAEVLHQFFDATYKADQYETSFWLQLRRMYPHLYNRERALDIVRISAALAGTYEELRAGTLAMVEESYRNLNNHGYLAVLVEPLSIEGRLLSSELTADLILFAEKHVQVELRKGYFQHTKIKASTSAYIPGLDVERASFSVANEGFTYRDTFILAPSVGAPMEETSHLVILQKNARDETLIPCPACRSHNIQGNSYPSLGVRSWECGNLLCPDRSKYNRGKRYSFRALLMQEAIDDERNEISPESVKGWMRDVQFGRNDSDVLAMLVRHFSLHGDTIHLFGPGWLDTGNEILGRRVAHAQIPQTTTEHRAHLSSFFSSPLFERYIVSKAAPRAHEPARVTSSGLLTVVQDDCFAYLTSQPADSFDGAVTSPPYYNAREYAQWENIYCYMYDMYNIGVQLYRVLKPGSLFLYNIFDYFDNERSIVFSAMGQKRMILSAYAVDAFRRAGFACLGNVAWDKGDIEGKRGFNAGNFSPYYQTPFNCWEHILVFQKPGGKQVKLDLPAVLQAKPVIKMVRGENTHGHTAPFPVEVPALLAPFVPSSGRVIDPFGGSATTARALCPLGVRVTCVERDPDYCRLALEMGSGEAEVFPAMQRAARQIELLESPIS